AQKDFWTAADLVEHLGRLSSAEEKHDGLSVRPETAPPVRIMNLHKAKGLQAPVVFLAGPAGRWNPPANLHIDRSGAKVRGFMAIRGSTGGFNRPMLACPAGWDACVEEEKLLRNAEEVRLLYVAATRAGSRLVVTQRMKGNSKNPWMDFGGHLADCPSLPDPGPQSAPSETPATIGPGEFKAARDAIGGRRQAISRKTYDVAAAKETSVGRRAASSGGGEDGAKWGSVVHMLLDTLMRTPDADVRNLAVSALREHELTVERADEAVALARSVTESDIWRRAQRSGKC
ncbi:unnamed protein product, partial [marine sediment metagenome]